MSRHILGRQENEVKGDNIASVSYQEELTDNTCI